MLPAGHSVLVAQIWPDTRSATELGHTVAPLPLPVPGAWQLIDPPRGASPVTARQQMSPIVQSAAATQAIATPAHAPLPDPLPAAMQVAWIPASVFDSQQMSVGRGHVVVPHGTVMGAAELLVPVPLLATLLAALLLVVMMLLLPLLLMTLLLPLPLLATLLLLPLLWLGAVLLW